MFSEALGWLLPLFYDKNFVYTYLNLLVLSLVCAKLLK